MFDTERSSAFRAWHSALSEEVREGWQHLFDDVTAREIADEIRSAKTASESSSLGIVQGYREGECGIEVGVRVRGPEAADFVAILERAPIERRDFGVTEPTRALHVHDVHEHLMVFVGDVERMEDGQLMQRWIRSLIRLYPVENASQPQRQPRLDIRKLSPLNIHARPLRSDRETRSAAMRDGQLLAGRQNDLPREVVERGPKVVNRITENERDVIGHLGDDIKVVDVLRSIAVVLSPHGIATRGFDCFTFHVKIQQVGVCPPDFLLDVM
jgi:hypothetical protein